MSKSSLKGLDIVVSYREATLERSENLYTVLRHLDHTYCDYQLWLMEADTAPHFEWARLADPNIRHVFLPHEGLFPKSLLYNTGARLASAPVVCFHDADCVSRPEYLVYCVERMLTEEGSDVLGLGVGAMCPFQSMLNIAGATKQAFVEQPDFAVFPEIVEGAALPADTTLLYPYNVGGVFLFRRRLYMEIGGCNPACLGWGSEDNELFARATRLGVNWQVVPKPMFHLNHDSPVRDGYTETEQAKKNFPHEEAARQMPLADLQAMARQLSGFFA